MEQTQTKCTICALKPGCRVIVLVWDKSGLDFYAEYDGNIYMNGGQRKGEQYDKLVIIRNLLCFT